jgi:formylglycine-generating enzyme required for sulfatase activity
LLVTEVVLDGESFGFDLRDAVREHLPHLRCIYTTRYDLSGYEAELDVSNALPVTLPDEMFVDRVESIYARPPTGQLHARQTQRILPPSSILAPGTLLGNYQVLELLHEEPETETYSALQYTVQRRVALVLLKPKFMTDPEVVSEFKDRERVKASFNHPRIAPLYEAGEASGWLYYTRELPNGESLDQLVAQGKLLNERQLVEVIFRVSEAMSYAEAKDCSHRPLQDKDIFLDAEGQCSIVNIFRQRGPKSSPPKEDVARSLTMLSTLCTQGKARSLIQQLLSEKHDWESLCQTLQEMRDEMSERSLLKRAAKEEDITIAPSKTHSALLWLGGALLLAAVAWLGGLSSKEVARNSTATLGEETFVTIPDGDFIYQNGQTKYCPSFAISKHEITIGQYAAFLNALNDSKDKRAFDDPLQARLAASKPSHEPELWNQCYSAAKTGGLFNKEPISLNTPVTGVDYWDALAYARWRKARLPTEEEWEKAARGRSGHIYPWGNAPQPSAANLGEDYSTNGAGGMIDGHMLWAPINDDSKDMSEYGIADMAGNVEEWTSSSEAHPTLADKSVPVVRGGHFGLTIAKGADKPLTRRVAADSAEETTLARGFRIAK